MGTQLIGNIKTGDMFVLLAPPAGGLYCAERVSKKSAIWNYHHVQANAAAVNAKTMVEVLKSDCGSYIGFRSHHAEGKILQACKDKGTILRFNNHNFDKWEQWTIHGSSLDKTLLVNRKFPDKQFEASFQRVLFTTQGALNRFLMSLNAKLKEKLSQSPSSHIDEIPEKFNTQVQNVLTFNGDDCIDLENSSKLHNIIEQAFSMMMQEVETAREQDGLRVKRQYMEYESMLKAAYKKAQDLQVQVNQIRESSTILQTEADQRLDSLLHELENTRFVAEGAVASQAKLKLIEEEHKRAESELILSKSLVHKMEVKDRMARDEVEKLTLQCNSMGREVIELKTLLNDVKAKKKAKDDELLLKNMALEEELRTMNESNMKESLKEVENERCLTRKRAAELESELRQACERTRVSIQAELQQKLLHQSSDGFAGQNKLTLIKNDQSNLVLTDSSNAAHGETAPDKCCPMINTNLEEFEVKQEDRYDLKKLFVLEAQIKENKSMIEQLEGQKVLLEEKEACNQSVISELVAQLENSENENLRNKELMSHMHQKIVDVQKDCDSLMEKLKRVERKAEADMLRLKVLLESDSICQDCTDMIAALVVLSNKIVRLEGTFQAVRSTIKSNLEASRISVSALEIDLLCCKETVSSLQSSLKDAEIRNDATGSRIESITRGFTELKEELTNETRRLEMQIVRARQRVSNQSHPPVQDKAWDKRAGEGH